MCMDQGAKGLLLLVDADGRFERTITDGDLRRLFLQGVGLEDSLDTIEPMVSQVISEGATRREALDRMNQHGINHLPVIGSQGQVLGILDRKEIDVQILLSTPHIGAKERQYVEEAFKTNWIAPLGPNVDSFERELADVVGVGHAAALSSGTAALHLGLRLLGVRSGDKVFCSTLTSRPAQTPSCTRALNQYLLTLIMIVGTCRRRFEKALKLPAVKGGCQKQSSL